MLCDRALLGAYAGGLHRVDRNTIDRAAKEVFDRTAPDGAGRTRRVASWSLAAVVGVVAAGAAWFGLNGGLPRLGGGPMVAQAARPASAVASGPSAARSAIAASGVASSASAPAVAAAPMRAASAGEFVAPAELKARFATLHRSERDAWRELAPAWKLELDAGDPCVVAVRQQVQCYRSSTTLAMIRQLGRPGVVTLYDEDNRPIYALLTGLTNRDATLRMGTTALTVSLVSLAGIWRGEFATYWRAPPGYGQRTADVWPRPLTQWLSTQLGALESAAPAAARPASGVALKSRVVAFQLAQGLKPDGLVGPTTLMLLNRATGVEEPRLDTEG
jgi:general secretion pathway protein A